MSDQRPHRDYVFAVCERMKINGHQIFDNKLMEAAWPAIDREGASAAECLRANLGKSFEVYEDAPGTNGVEVHKVK